MKIHKQFLSFLGISLFAGLLIGCSNQAQKKPLTQEMTTPTTEATPTEYPGFLTDNRMALLEAREYPWSTLGRLNVAGRHFCNGVMVGVKDLLAPASCLYDLVEGRWFQPKEMVFVAGYQRDDSTIFSTADSYQIARGFLPQNKTLKSLLNNWALIRLNAPLGDHTGWVGVRNSVSTQDLEILAGYRRGWEHVQALYPFCNQTTNRKENCPQRSDGPLNRFILETNGLSLAPNHAIDPQTYAGWGLSDQPQTPRKVTYVSPLPQNTVQRLLVDLYYLDKASSDSNVDINKATSRAQKDLGTSVTGQADIKTLYLLLKELNRLRSGKPIS